MNKFFEERITHKALQFKLMGQLSGRLVDSLIAENPNAPEIKANFKNVCAPIPLSMNERLESVIGLLDLSKRDFLTMAIASALDDAEAIIGKLNVFEYIEDDSKKIEAIEGGEHA